MNDTEVNCPTVGWKRIVCERKRGKTAGKHDVYFVNPDGKRLRSLREVSRYLEKKGLNLSLELFCFKTTKRYRKNDFTKLQKKAKCASESSTTTCRKRPTVSESNHYDRYQQDMEDEMHQSLRKDQVPKNQSVTFPDQAYIQTSPYFPSCERVGGKIRTSKHCESLQRKQNQSAEETAFKVSGKVPPGLEKFFAVKYVPPKSPFHLIQEELYGNPWKLLVATVFLNKTSGQNAIPVLWKFFEHFPNAETTSKANPEAIEEIIRPLGLFRKRAQILIRFSLEYLGKMWESPSELYGIGKYGNDSFRIFCLGEYQNVYPDDQKLNLYHTWLCEKDREILTAHTR